MAQEQKPNYLLMASLSLVAAYWIFAPFVTNPYLSIACALMLLVSATLAMLEYAPETYLVVVKRWRSSDPEGRGRGSHLAIYGVFLISFGSVFSGAYGLLWAAAGQPPDWIGSASANFGRACHAVGFALMQASPNLTAKGLQFDKGWLSIAIGAVILILIGFYIGVSVNVVEMTESMRTWKSYSDSRLGCPPPEGGGVQYAVSGETRCLVTGGGEKRGGSPVVAE
ncbi:membrane protein of unknown function [Pseudorhizobium banfieldiae]|uniref:Transmembrane protein n=1 Tax=Pseudorhizobium banfieldiae TaxID=1125847 RepID=L0NEG8_9HYPH|nr:hypothetical protein [Pseudorhizobium banfieldiae]CAD6606322.1 hypothetical protein RNT25_01841 [arsenite-oxidising bacterium NT-25]CCF19186.1 membrane protein of unknown function [Pseudorhizobium banfieldiae]